MREEFLLKALMFAAEKHKDQRRKGSGGTPYINHLIEVVNLLSEAKVDNQDVLVASILHDVLEDTDTTAEEIESKFGCRVSELVQAVTDDRRLSLEERRRIQLEKISKSPNDIKFIKLADHCSNIASLPDSWEAERLNSYMEWSYNVASECFDVSSMLQLEYTSRYENAVAIISGKST